MTLKTLLSDVLKQAGNQTEIWYGAIDQGIPYEIFIAPPSSNYKIKVIAKPNNGLGKDERETDTFQVK